MTAAQRLIAVCGILTFAFLGAIQALYGPLLPGLRTQFAVDAAQVGLLFTAHGLGALLGIFLPSLPLLSALTSHWLRIATGLLTLGAAALLVAPSWPLMLASAFVLALGFGIHVVRLNSLFVAGFGTRGMTMSLLINAAFSIGSILGPAILGSFGEPSRSIYGGVAAVALALLPLTALTEHKLASTGTGAPAVASDARAATSGSYTLLIAFVALMCLTSGVENSIGGWTTTLALARGYSFREAANLTALFFGGVLLGRLLAAAIGHRLSAQSLVIGAIGCKAALLSIAALTPAGTAALAVAGLAIAPIFSTTLVWVGAALPRSRHVNAFVIGGALLGAAVFPALVGRAIGQLGARSAIPVMVGLAAASLAVAIWIALLRRR